MARQDVIVVGAGLAGLCAALDLVAAGRGVTLLEAADRPGGRVRTDVVRGFRLDRGFQVYLTAYPHARRRLDHDALHLRPFRPGALVRRYGRMRRVADPLRDLPGGVQTLLGGVGSLADKLRVLALRLAVSRGTVDDLFAQPATTTAAALSEAGFSDELLDGFWRPFLGGVFFDPDLSTTSRMMRFVVRMFAEGPIAVPELGMEAMPRQLAARLPDGVLRCGVTVAEVGPRHVVTTDGLILDADHVVLATEAPVTARLLGEPVPPSRTTTTLWFAADRSPVGEPTLVLDGDHTGPVNHLAVMSDVAPTYAPVGASLIAANVLGIPPGDDDTLDAAVRRQLRAWWGTAMDRWERLAVHRIHHALPVQVPEGPPPAAPAIHGSGVVLAGDHRVHASIEGAMVSGARAARAVLAR